MRYLALVCAAFILLTSWLPAAELPTGTFKGTGFIVEKGQFRMTEKDLSKHEASVTIKSLGGDKYSFNVRVSVQKAPTSPVKNDARNDIYVVKWTSDKAGDLVNTDPKFSGDKSSFTMADSQLIIKSWVDRNQLWETHKYSLKD